MLSIAGYTAPGRIGIGSSCSGASCLVRGPVLQEACSAARGTRAQSAYAYAHRLGWTLPSRAPGIVMQTHIGDFTSVLTYDDLRGW